MATKKKKTYVSLEDVAKLNNSTTSINPLYQLSNITKEIQNYDNFAKTIDYSKVYAPKDKVDFGLHWSTPLDVLKNTVGLVGGAVTTGLYNRIKDVKKFSQDPSLLGAGKLALDLTPIPDASKIGIDAYKGQKKAWTDGKYSWSDIPLVGALKGIGDKQKYGEDILNEVGMNEGIGRTALGIGLDVALDPLTYLTGGAATASKLGKVAEAEKIANVADDLGIVGKFKNIADFTPEMEKALIQKHPNLVRNNSELFDKLITKKLDSITEAKNVAYNANINKRGLFAPFTNKGVLVEDLPVPFANKLGNVGKKSLLFRSEAKVKPQLVDDVIKQLTQNGEYAPDEVRQFIKNRYGTDELTKNQFSDLYDLTKSTIEKNPEVSIAPTGKMETKVVDEILKGDTVNYEKDYSNALKTIKNKEHRNVLSKILKNHTPEEFSQLSDKELISLMKKEIETGKANIPSVFGSLDKETAKNLKKTFNSKSFIKAVKSVREEITKTIPAVPEQRVSKMIKTLVPDEEILIQRKRNLDESQRAFKEATDKLAKHDEDYANLGLEVKKGQASIAEFEKQIKELNNSVDPKVEKELIDQLAKDKENLEIAKAQLNGKPMDEAEKNILFGQAAKGFNDFKTKLALWIESGGKAEKPMYKDLLSGIPNVATRNNLRFALTDLVNGKYGDLTGAKEMTQRDYAELLDEALRSPRLNKKVANNSVQADIDFFSKQIPKGEQKLAEIAEAKNNHTSLLEGLTKQKEEIQKVIDEQLQNLSLTKTERAELLRLKNEATTNLKVASKEHSAKPVMKEIEKQIEEIIPEVPEKTITKTVIKKGTAKDVDSPKVKLLDALKKIGLQKLEEPITKQLNLVPVEKQAEVMEKLDKAVSRYDEVVSEFRRNAKGKATIEKVENQGAEILHREVEHIFESYKHGTPEELLNKQKRNVSKLFENEHNGMGDFKTNFEHWLDKKNIFNARTLNTGDKLLNSIGDVITDADSNKAGHIKFHQKALNEIKNDFEKLATTEGEKRQLWEEIGYTLEKQAPKAYGENWKAPQEVQALAKKVKAVLGKIGQDELDSGVLKGLNENYFMHNVNMEHPFLTKDEKAFNKKLAEINGKKASNAHGLKREGFQTLAEWRDKIAELEDKLAEIPKEDKKGRLTLHREIDFLNDLYDLSGVDKLQNRVNSSASAITTRKMFDELKKFGQFAEGHGGVGKSDLVPFQTLAKELGTSATELANKFGLEKGKTYRMSREVFNAIRKNNEIWKSENVEKAMSGLDKISDAFRALTTYYKPSHFTNNALGNILNNAFYGIKPSDYTGATKLLRGYAEGTLSESQMRIMELALKRNIISGGSYVDIKSSNLLNDNPVTRFMRHGKFTKEGAAEGNRLFSGEMIEDVSRLANFLNGMDKYGEVGKAAKQVREALFNYNELSNADRKMRRLIPFWNWTKNNLPLQVKQLMENPKFALNIQRFKEVFNDGQEGEDWQKESGIKIGDRYYSFQSPTNDLNFFNNPVKALASGVTPPLRMPIEWYANKKIYTGTPISYPDGSSVNSARLEDLPNYALSNFGILKNANELINQNEKSKKSKKDILFNLLVPNTKIK